MDSVERQKILNRSPAEWRVIIEAGEDEAWRKYRAHVAGVRRKQFRLVESFTGNK